MRRPPLEPATRRVPHPPRRRRSHRSHCPRRYKRFRHDPKAVDELVASFFTQADTSHDGVVTFSEYHAWALSQPSVFLFFHKLSGLVQGLVDEHKKATSFKNKDSPSPRMGTLAEDEA